MDKRILSIVGFGLGLIWAYEEDRKYRLRKAKLQEQKQQSKVQSNKDPQIIVIEVRA